MTYPAAFPLAVMLKNTVAFPSDEMAGSTVAQPAVATGSPTVAHQVPHNFSGDKLTSAQGTYHLHHKRQFCWVGAHLSFCALTQYRPFYHFSSAM